MNDSNSLTLNRSDFVKNENNKTFGNNNAELRNSQIIKEFYNYSTIFVTGGTGFIGKVLIEKLLRTCTSLSAIYVLVRPKSGHSSEQRYADLIQNPIFDRIRATNSNQLTKIVCISGDISQPSLGLSKCDLNKLIENVTIVFHSAATVRFDQNLGEAVNMNALGSKRLWELCADMKILKSIVHVSTAYSNPNRKEVKEMVYAPKLEIDIDTFIKCVNSLPADVVDSISHSIEGPHPNTYTLTKSFAEQITADFHHKLPICILRPSIITAAIEEPFPGWIDNINGITGIMTEIGRGTISSIMCDKNLVMDLIPVDIVSNMMIAAAWLTYFKPSNCIRVYNCTSGQINPIFWHQFGDATLKYARENPTKYVLLYPNFTYRTNRFIHRIYELFLHFLPAILYDILLKMKGSKAILFKIAKRYKAAADTGEFFARNEWIFETNNVAELVKEVCVANDGDEFNCDVSNMNWDEYIKNYMFGIRKYVLKDGLESMKGARKSVKRLYATKCAFQFVFLCFILYYIANLLLNKV